MPPSMRYVHALMRISRSTNTPYASEPIFVGIKRPLGFHPTELPLRSSGNRAASTSIQHEKHANVPPVVVQPTRFHDQVVVITGAASGIGETTARLFAQQGAQVVMIDIDEHRLKRVQDEIAQAGGRAAVELCNIGSDAAVTEVVNAIIKLHTKIDVLVNIAGIYPWHLLEDYPTEVYQKIMSVNLDGSFFLTRAVLPHMRKAGYGRIIHTSSATFAHPVPGIAPYVASKAGVIGLVRAAAVEAGTGVTVNAVLPGLIDTPGSTSMQNAEEVFDRVIARQIIKRKGHPLDLAYTYSFIASPEAAFFTGQMFDCSGGETFH